MIVVLGFASPERCRDGRVVRLPVFRSRSTLPISAACLIANGVREQLSRLLATELDVDLIEPVVPDAAERRVLVEGATIFRVRGRLCDGFVIVRAADARRLVALAFGENERSERDPLSDIERATLDRIASALVPLCNTLCGTLGPVVRETSERVSCDLASYFEVRTTGVARIALGFGVTRDPPEDIGERLTLADLADVELAGTVEFARGAFAVPAFSCLAPGATIVLDTQLGAPGELRFGDVAFAAATCGVRDGRNAILIEHDRGAIAGEHDRGAIVGEHDRSNGSLT